MSQGEGQGQKERENLSLPLNADCPLNAEPSAGLHHTPKITTRAKIKSPDTEPTAPPGASLFVSGL